MKIKFASTVLLAGFINTVANAQTKTNLVDAFPDIELIRALEKLPDPSATDTAASLLTINLRGENINLELYELAKTLQSASGFSGKEARLVQMVIESTSNERKIADLILAFSGHANYLSKNTFNFSTGSPQQNKIAYSWGSKQFEKRANPPGKGDLCKYEIHGLDCSGFIYQLFSRSGIHLPVAQCNADTERKPAFLTRYLKPYFGTTPFIVQDLGKLKIKDMVSGDIIYFKNVAGAVVHIAIVLLNESGVITIYQSIGNPNRNPKNFSWCEKNIDNDHGVKAKILDSSIENGRDYSCVRIKSI